MKKVLILTGILIIFVTLLFAEGIKRTEHHTVVLEAQKNIQLSEGYYELGYRKNGGNWHVLKTNEGEDFDGTVPEGKKWKVVIQLMGEEVDAE